MTLPLNLSEYKKRHFYWEGVWEIDSLAFKTYFITTDSALTVSDDMARNAKSYLELALPAIRQQEGQDHGLGYIILHMGEMGNWLLAHWWAHEDIAMRLLASADIGHTMFKSEDHRRFHACVWEHIVINYERDVWVRHAMTQASSSTAYLNDRMPNGYY